MDRRLVAIPVSLLALAGSAAPAAAAAAGQPAPSARPAASARLVVERVYRLQGQRVALRHQKVRVVGLAPSAVGQVVRVTVRIRRRTVVRSNRTVGPDGRFSLELRAHRVGPLRAYGTLPGAAAARSRVVQVIVPAAGPGARGVRVVFLQHRLRDLRYLVPYSGVYDSGTANAVMAYRKLSGMPRAYSANRRIFSRLAVRRGRFHVRYPGHGKHAEANLSRQVLALIDRKGKVFRILTVSSGKPSTPTVLGSFRVYSQTPGFNSHGMLDSNYFHGGYAIHGYADVPPYAASHGCLRIPIPNARFVMHWLRFGDRVDVYR
jgi:lipoprotein-anchoring transpeptidase ErfK/SrfK